MIPQQSPIEVFIEGKVYEEWLRSGNSSSVSYE